MRSELNSLNMIQIVAGKKNVKRVKIGNEIKERRGQIIPRSVPRGRFDYCIIQTLILYKLSFLKHILNCDCLLKY